MTRTRLQFMRPFTMRFVNPLTIRLAGHLPAFGILGYDLRTRGRDIHLFDPELVHDPERRLMPQPVRTFLGFMNVEHFLRLRSSPSPPDVGAGLDRRGESA